MKAMAAPEPAMCSTAAPETNTELEGERAERVSNSTPPGPRLRFRPFATPFPHARLARSDHGRNGRVRKLEA